MKVIVRADASPAIGSGHVVRCLALADALHRRGADICFASHDMPPALRGLVEQQGHALAALPACDRDEVADAQRTLHAAGSAGSVVVVDHYALGAAWESAVRAQGARVLAIDDLERRHDCDILLDQNFHPGPDTRYAASVPAACERLLGPRYALLRADFAQARRRTAPRDGIARRLLVFMGGMDAGNATQLVLDALQRLDRRDFETDVVLGASHPALEQLRALCASRAGLQCHVQTPDMAGLLARADLAIGAGGSATWERCALGVPTLALCLADNQRELLRQAGRHGLVCAPDFDGGIDTARLALHVQALLDNAALRHQLSRNGMALVDALGAERVAAALLPPRVELRLAQRTDADDLYRWRNDPAVRAVSRHSAPIALDDHRRWLDGVLASPARRLLIGRIDGTAAGVVRFDIDATIAEVSIYLVPGRSGRGEGTALLRAAEDWLRLECPDVATLRAQVNEGNDASRRLFERGGYAPTATHYAKRT